MYAVDLQGRILFVRLASPLSGEDMARFIEKTRILLGASGLRQVVTLGDLRQLHVLAPDAVDMLIQMFVRSKPIVERTAILMATTKSSLGMQLSRVMRETKNESRRLFDDADAAVAYVGSVLSPAERERVEAFVRLPAG